MKNTAAEVICPFCDENSDKPVEILSSQEQSYRGPLDSLYESDEEEESDGEISYFSCEDDEEEQSVCTGETGDLSGTGEDEELSLCSGDEDTSSYTEDEGDTETEHDSSSSSENTCINNNPPLKTSVCDYKFSYEFNPWIQEYNDVKAVNTQKILEWSQELTELVEERKLFYLERNIDGDIGTKISSEEAEENITTDDSCSDELFENGERFQFQFSREGVLHTSQRSGKVFICGNEWHARPFIWLVVQEIIDESIVVILSFLINQFDHNEVNVQFHTGSIIVRAFKEGVKKEVQFLLPILVKQKDVRVFKTSHNMLMTKIKFKKYPSTLHCRLCGSNSICDNRMSNFSM